MEDNSKCLWPSRTSWTLRHWLLHPVSKIKKGRKRPICLWFHIILERIFRSRKKNIDCFYYWYFLQAKQGKGISMTYPKTASLVCKPNTMRQRNGFPPNFVHSLDSSHMMLTSLYLWSQGNIDSVTTPIVTNSNVLSL